MIDVITSGESLSIRAKVEAIVFASPKPIKVSEIIELLSDDVVNTRQIMEILDELNQIYRSRRGGFQLEHFKGFGYQFRTVPEAAPLMEKMFAGRPRPLSRAAQETLAIIAYRQPVTRADIEFIRGVDAGSILKHLLERGMVACLGRREDAGRPMLFGTTDEFLRVYGLGDLSDLPPLEAFQPASDVISTALEKIGAKQVADIEDVIRSRADDEEEHHDQLP